MINKYLAMGLGALIALAPVAALAQEQVAQASTDSTSMASPTKGHTGSHRAHQRKKASTSRHRARASAHHMHKKAAAPAEAPKS
jgi:hypothetical protein